MFLMYSIEFFPPLSFLLPSNSITCKKKSFFSVVRSISFLKIWKPKLRSKILPFFEKLGHVLRIRPSNVCIFSRVGRKDFGPGTYKFSAHLRKSISSDFCHLSSLAIGWAKNIPPIRASKLRNARSQGERKGRRRRIWKVSIFFQKEDEARTKGEGRADKN